MNVKILLIIMSTCSLLNAQNARIDALGGNFAIDDISAVSNYPASAKTFSDMVQATAYQNGSFGPVFGIKSLGDCFAVGISANSNETLSSQFYQNAKAYLDSIVNTFDSLDSSFPPYPHLTIAFSLHSFAIGIEAFYKRTKLEDNFSTGKYRNVFKKDIMNSGAFIGLSLQLLYFGLYPYFGFSFPKAQGLLQTNTTDTSIAVFTTNNRCLEFGIESGFEIKNVYSRIGIYFANSNYSFSTSRPQNFLSPSHSTNYFNVYSGINFTPSQNILLSLGYSFDKTVSETSANDLLIDSQSRSDVALTDKCHFFVASCEYTIPTNRFLEAVILRSGVSFTISESLYTSSIGSPEDITNASYCYPADVSDFRPTFGFGIVKSFFHFDVASNLAGWSGLISGMPVITGTLTFDFRNKSLLKQN